MLKLLQTSCGTSWKTLPEMSLRGIKNKLCMANY